MSSNTIPTHTDDPVNQQILAVSEDQLQGFHEDPMTAIAKKTGLDVQTVIDRIRAMLEAGAIRRVRQTLLATSLAPGALVAWQVPADQLDAAFDWMYANDPFTGHVVLRSTDRETAGSTYKLWTTLKVPVGFSMAKHADYLKQQVGAEAYKLLPARKVFALGVGHMRRRKIQPGDRADEPGRVLDVAVAELDEKDWRVLLAIKREFKPEELTENLWAPRAAEAGVELEEFFRVAHSLDERRVIGRFSTFLEHVKKHADGKAVTRYNALFHWAVPSGREIDAGQEVGRHHIMTHAYWREGGPEFGGVNIMGVAHGLDKDAVLAHKAAIDAHLEEAGIPLKYTNVFWGGRSEIKPSEISPVAYRQWLAKQGLSEDAMKDDPACEHE